MQRRDASQRRQAEHVVVVAAMPVCIVLRVIMPGVVVSRVAAHQVDASGPGG
jgi:hypothetical protein